MYDKSNTLEYMKIAKTFRLSQEAVAKLDEQDNATQYLEDLILNSGQRTMQVVSIQQLEALLEPLKQTIDIKQEESMLASSRPTAWSTIQIYPNEMPARSRNDITTEINQLEAERDDRLEYSQDYAENKKIALEYKTKIDSLWDEFHALGKSDG